LKWVRHAGLTDTAWLSGPKELSNKGGNMKKALILSLILGSCVVILPAVNANAASPYVGKPQIRIQLGGNNRRRHWERERARRERAYLRSLNRSYNNGYYNNGYYNNGYYNSGRTMSRTRIYRNGNVTTYRVIRRRNY
jgi:hypothetical protein